MPSLHCHSILNRINFGDLTLGLRFHDSISADYFVKQIDTMAAMVTDALLDEFGVGGVVGIGP